MAKAETTTSNSPRSADSGCIRSCVSMRISSASPNLWRAAPTSAGERSHPDRRQLGPALSQQRDHVTVAASQVEDATDLAAEQMLHQHAFGV